MLTDSSVRAYLDSLAKPPGSLGRLEDLAVRLGVIQQTLTPRTHPRRVVLFAADHGVVRAGVSAWPADVTRLMVETIRSGRAASSVLAATSGTDLQVIDVGTLAPAAPDTPTFRSRKVRAGTRNLAEEPALTVPEFRAAVAIGQGAAERARQDGMHLVAAGEMGIGNTTPASCLTALLTNADADQVTGRGAGADDAILARKRDVVRQAIAPLRTHLAADPEAALAAVSGLEIAAMAGFFRHAAACGLTIVLDGFIATSAALIAEHLWPGTVRAMIAAHRSAEPGHTLALAHLGLVPVLSDWEMRLGEGTGALVMLPLLDAAAAILTKMATLESVLGGRA